MKPHHYANGKYQSTGQENKTREAYFTNIQIACR